jgi:ubiquinone/menaquinone biosynthesis C-methylase UbiE
MKSRSELTYPLHDGVVLGGLRALVGAVRRLGSARGEYIERAVQAGAERVLDVGCSRGWTLNALTGKAAELWGVDIDAHSLEQARISYPHIHFKHQTAAALPFPDTMFDVVILSEVIEHVGDENKKAIIDEIHRVLKAGGVLILTAPYAGLFAWTDPMDFKRRFPGLYRLYMRLTGYAPHTPVEIGHKHVTLQEVVRLFDGRFAIEEVCYCGLFMPAITWLLLVGARLRLLPRRVEAALNRLRAWESGVPYGPILSFNLRLLARRRGEPCIRPSGATRVSRC